MRKLVTSKFSKNCVLEEQSRPFRVQLGCVLRQANKLHVGRGGRPSTEARLFEL